MYKTEQENFWAGDFGNEYIERNKDDKILASATRMFAKALGKTSGDVKSVLEFGPNIGMNLKAIKHLIPDVKLGAIEINRKAVDILIKSIPDVKVWNTSILEWNADDKFDLTFTCGVLIHINPDELDKVYEKLYSSSSKYILIAEYYNPKPVEVNYRGHEGRLFKRDFAGDLMDRYGDLRLVDYGFVYHRDYVFPQDDTTWFLLEKTC